MNHPENLHAEAVLAQMRAECHGNSATAAALAGIVAMIAELEEQERQAHSGQVR